MIGPKCNLSIQPIQTLSHELFFSSSLEYNDYRLSPEQILGLNDLKGEPLASSMGIKVKNWNVLRGG